MGSQIIKKLKLANQSFKEKLTEPNPEPEPVEKETFKEVKPEPRKINQETNKQITSDIMQEYTQSNYHFLKLIIKWKFHFIIVSVAAVIVASVFSSELFIPAKYKSFAIIYPSNLTPYGHESPAEQMMQLLESADIRNSIIKKFDLAKRYEIDTAAKSGKSALISTYESNVTVSRTQFESVEIKVLDTDPKVACDMVKEIIVALNLKARNLQRDKTKEVLVVLTNEMNYKQHQLDSINSHLNEIRNKYHILDYKSQSKEVIKGYVKSLVSGKSNKEINEMMNNLELKGGDYYGSIKLYDELVKGFSVTKLLYDETWKDMTKELTYTNMVTYPSPSDKKAYPIRSLIVLISAVSANMFLFLVLVILDSKKRLV